MLENKNSKNYVVKFSRPYPLLWPLILFSCGGNKSKDTDTDIVIGFSSDYIPPVSSFEEPTHRDPHYKKLEPVFSEPYWISALEMANGTAEINQMLVKHGRVIKFSFPSEAPDYLPVMILGWAPASQNMVNVSRDIFSEISKILDVELQEVDNPSGFNNLSISQSIQTVTAGYSYFPNPDYELGSDIFISKDYSNPVFLNSGRTNYDYEVIVHEIGHALGLKHPFEADRSNTTVLNTHEDNTKFTAMSYNEDFATFNGLFRALDWMALTKLYGVNPEFNAADNVYAFDNENGVFVIDGNGIDTISMSHSEENIFIDLRPGTHSYEGQKATFITSAQQLTISHGSFLENVETGSGSDFIIGNDLSNVISSGAGNDEIFGGNGADTIFPGSGNNVIDLSEDDDYQDTIIIDKVNINDEFDILFGFTQGVQGDIIDLKNLDLPHLTFLPVVDVSSVPSGYINNCLVRVIGPNLSNSTNVSSYFESGGVLENLSLSNEVDAILVTANSENTGEIQNIFSLTKGPESIDVNHIMQLVGNYMDIDVWSLENFIV